MNFLYNLKLTIKIYNSLKKIYLNLNKIFNNLFKFLTNLHLIKLLIFF